MSENDEWNDPSGVEDGELDGSDGKLLLFFVLVWITMLLGWGLWVLGEVFVV